MKNVMKNAHILLIIYLIFVLIKILLAIAITSPTIFSDEYIYSKAARSFIQGDGFKIHGEPIIGYPPLYSIVISPAYLFQNTHSVYFIMKIINAFLSSTILFAAYLIFKEFFDARKALYGSILAGVMPLALSITPYILSENLFAPLFLFSVYFIYKSITDNNVWFSLTAAACMSLSYLTRYIGIVLFAYLGVLFVIFFARKKWHQVTKISIVGILAVLAPLLWTFRNTSGGEPQVIALITTTVLAQNTVASTASLILYFILWVLIHCSYIILATGTIPSLASIRWKELSEKEKIWHLLVGCISLVLIVIISRRAVGLGIKEVTPILGFPGRIIGRYIDMILPLFLVTGFIHLEKMKNRAITKVRLFFIGFIVVCGFLLFYYPLLPFNNASLAAFGFLKMIIEYAVSGFFETAHISFPTLTIVLGIIILTFLGLYFFDCKKKIIFSNAFWFLLVFFVVSSTASIAASTYSAHQWAENEQLALGKYLSHTIASDKRVIIDEKYCGERMTPEDQTILCTQNAQLTYVGFWINNDIRITSPRNAQQGNYIITRDELNKTIVYKTKSGILVYQS